MSLSILRNDLNSAEQHRLVQSVRRVFNGASSGTPSPNILRFQDVGLLYFLNQKQSRFHRAIASVDVDAHESLLPLRNLITFVTTSVGWLIVEAERVDEAIIATQRDLGTIGNELREVDMDLQYQSSHTGTEVMRAIAEHHHTRVNVPTRRHHASIEQFDVTKSEALGELPVRIVELRRRFQATKEHLKVLKITQRLLHGNKNAKVPQVEADAIVGDLSVLTTFRKAAHKVRDAVFDVPERENLEAIASLLEVFAYIDRGMTAALDDLEHCQIQLKKAVLLAEKQSRMEHLDELDARNKQLSSAALRHNEELGHDVGRVALGDEDYFTSALSNHRPFAPERENTAPREQKATPSRATPAARITQRPGATPSFISPGMTPVGARAHQHAMGGAGVGHGGMGTPSERAASIASHTSEMDEFLQHYCS